MMPTTSNQVQHINSHPVTAPRPIPEYTVRVHSNLRRQFNVMKFNSSNNIDVSQWNQASLERENNIKEYRNDDEMPKFGAGSEYGREQREEARRKKYGIQLKKYNPDDQPWILKVGGKGGKKYKGIREGGVTENSSLYIFTQSQEGFFEAIPVSEWYNFAPIQRYKALSIEEAEEEYEKRNKVHNYFNVMKKKKAGDDADDEEEEKSEGKKKKKKKKDSQFKITELEDWSSDEEEEDSDEEDKEEDLGSKKKGGAKGKAGKKKGKGAKKKKDEEESGGEAMEESDEGDFDDREVDYITNSESSDEEPEEEKVNRQMKGVEDEDGLRKLTTESGDEEDEENPEEKAKEEGEPENGGPDAANVASAPTDAKTKDKAKKEPNSSDSSESSDSDFDDDSMFQSAMFMPKGNKKNGLENADKSTNQNKSPSKDNPKLKAIKRKALTDSPPAKKAKLDSTAKPGAGNKAAHEVITDEAIMRYLRRKPMTTKDLIHKFKKKVSDMSNKELVMIIAETLKRIEPQSMKIKDTLYFHIKS